MPIKSKSLAAPFPGASSQIWLPMPADAFQPKAWGIAEDWDTTGHVLTDAGATFETDSVVATDNVFIVDTTLGVAYATTVISVDSETQLTLAGSPAEPDQTNAVYKVGEGALHTLETLATIIDDRAIDAYTILLSVLWCDALIAAFNRDETGDVYVI